MAYILFEDRFKTRIWVFDGNNSLLCQELCNFDDILNWKVNLNPKNDIVSTQELNLRKQQLIRKQLWDFKAKKRI